MRVKWALIGLCGMTVRVHAQQEQTLSDLLPVLKTGMLGAEIEKSLIQRGFVSKPSPSAKEKLFQGMLDNGLVQLSVRKISKKGPIWSYRLVFTSTQANWMQKKNDFDQKLLLLNEFLVQSPSNTTKTLPQYCVGKEAECFRDGVSKYQSSWYWNNAVQRVKTVELKISPNYETVLEITDNTLETQ